MIPTLFVYSSSNKQASRVLFFDYSKTQKFDYFCPFDTFLFFSFHSLFAMYMFSLVLPFTPAKIFVFRVSKNICLSCHQKHFAFSSCRVIRVLHSEEKLTWSGLTVNLRNSTHERGYRIKLLLKRYHSLYAQCERENIYLILKGFCHGFSASLLTAKIYICFAGKATQIMAY